jgi:hypothetical protein
VSDAGPPRPGRARRPLVQAIAGMAAELVYVAALAGIGLMIAMAGSLVR